LRKVLFGLAAVTLVAVGSLSLSPAKAKAPGGITLDHRSGGYGGGYGKKYGDDYGKKYGDDYGKKYGGRHDDNYGGYGKKYGGYDNGYQHYR
jgi:hypothetical protein